MRFLGSANSDVAPDGCRTTCRAAFCGDGVQDSFEGCDDANAQAWDGCIDTCQAATCGDGYLQIGVEACDDGNADFEDACGQCTWNVSGYQVYLLPASFVPTPGAPIPGLLADDAIAPVPLGFPFYFAGAPVQIAYVSSNGFIAFDAPIDDYNNRPLPDATPPNALLAWWWDDLDAGHGGATITATITGVSPDRVQHFTFLGVPRYGNAGARVDAEVRLHESGGVIEIAYGSMTSPATSAFDATVGFEAAGGYGQDVLGCRQSCSARHWLSQQTLFFLPAQ